MNSLWKDTVTIPPRASLPGDMSAPDVVIGAGMAGILTAWFLKKKGREVIVLEANTIGSGQTGNTTAKITGQHGLFYQRMIQKVGHRQARMYAIANERAISTYEKIIRQENISCNFKRKPAYLYTTQEQGILPLQREMRAAQSLGIDATWAGAEAFRNIPFPVKGGIVFPNQAQFHPLKFIKHLSKELTIYEHTKVLSVKKNKVYTDKGVVTAENIIFATHYPITNVPGFYFLRQHQERSYILALEGQKELEGMYYGIDEDGLSLRSEGDRLLVGGGNHRTGKCICEQKKGKGVGYTFLKEQTNQYYPGAQIVNAWSAQDCMPHDDIPFIGRYSVFRPNWYVATGFKKWGMTSSMIAAAIISEMICGGDVKEKNVFSPRRFYIRVATKNLFIDLWESTVGLTKGLFASPEHKCTHLGCRLDWNPEESSWECPCHGSGYNKDGKIKHNPAIKDL